MEYYELHPVTPQRRYIDKAVEVLRSGGVIIYPTDTVYGIGCDIFHAEAVQRMMDIKHESGVKLFSFVCSDLKDIAKYAKVSDYAYRMMKKCTPGAYTFVLPAAKEVPKKLMTKRKTVGIRVPNHPIALELAKLLGNPITSSSVTNRLGEIYTDPEEIRNVFARQVDLMLASDHLKGKPSSIIDLSGETHEIIREGSGDISMFL